MSTSIAKAVTADELLAMPDDGHRYALVKGELIQMSPTGHDHGVVASNIDTALNNHVKNNKLGVTCGAETGFLLTQNPDTVRAPDAAFISQERLDAVGPVKSYWIGAPDLAVEVVSPSDTFRELEEKVAEWLEAGTRMVWVISPKLRTVTSYHSLTEIEVLTEKDSLNGGDVIPGFEMRVAELF